MYLDWIEATWEVRTLTCWWRQVDVIGDEVTVHEPFDYVPVPLTIHHVSTPPFVTVVSESHYQSTLDAVYVYVMPWSEFPIVTSFPHYTQLCSYSARARRHPGRRNATTETFMKREPFWQ